MEDPRTENDQQSSSHTSIEQRYLKIKENVETYPNVWGSFIVVYGGFGLLLGYKWRKLRMIEDKIRVLQERIGKLV